MVCETAREITDKIVQFSFHVIETILTNAILFMDDLTVLIALNL